MPKSDVVIAYPNNNVTSVLTIEVTRNKRIFLDSKEIVLNKVAKKVYDFKRLLPVESASNFKVLLKIDKSVSYVLIDALKTELSKATVNVVLYRTNVLEDVTQGVALRNQPALHYLNEQTEASNNTPSTVMTETIVFNVHPVTALQEDLYALKIESLKKQLKELNYKTVTILKNSKIEIGSKKFKIGDKDEIYQLLKDVDFYFLTTASNVNYNDYLQSMITLYKISKKNTYIRRIEVSKELKEALEVKKFNLF